ncbi:unnamed protein product, partial [Didymodactylos carnosus]
MLGDHLSACPDGTDEMSMSVNWQLLQCFKADDGACALLRDLSSSINDKRYILPFTSLCDSLWDLRNGIDETNCDEWICEQGWEKQKSSINGSSTGYCIDSRWFCNEIWDFSDGSDEYNCTYPLTLSAPDCLTLTKPEMRVSILEANSVAGNGLVECLGGIDERNTYACLDGFPLSNRFLCSDNVTCLLPMHLCDHHYDCPTKEDESDFWCGNRSLFSKNICTKHTFACLEINDSSPCIPNEHRCNNRFQCRQSHLDEYMCVKARYQSHVTVTPFQPPRLPAVAATIASRRMPFQSPTVSAWYCDRGLPVIRYNQLACLCPPSFYGARCEQHNHRITVVFKIETEHDDHKYLIRLAILLRYTQNTTIDHKVVTYSSNQYGKRRLYLNYPFSMYDNLFRPSSDYTYRLAVVFQFDHDNENRQQCSREQLAQCQHGKCYVIANNHTAYYCECLNGWMGKNCDILSSSCSCSPNSTCIRDNNKHGGFICICEARSFGSTCHLHTVPCPLNYCLNGGVCSASTNEILSNFFQCTCNDNYFGEQCQYKKASLNVTLENSTFTHPSVIQLLSYDTEKMELQIQRQEIMIGSTKFIQYNSFLLPSIGLLKTHSDALDQTSFYLLYTGLNHSALHLNGKGIRCSHAREFNLMPLDSSVESLLIKLKQYHKPCQKSTTNICFYDEQSYICFCADTDTVRRATCFQYDFTYDQYRQCMHGGRCFAGNKKTNKNDFVCHCPRCIYGPLCQYRMDHMGFSLESMLALDLGGMKE